MKTHCFGSLFCDGSIVVQLLLTLLSRRNTPNSQWVAGGSRVGRAGGVAAGGSPRRDARNANDYYDYHDDDHAY